MNALRTASRCDRGKLVEVNRLILFLGWKCMNLPLACQRKGDGTLNHSECLNCTEKEKGQKYPVLGSTQQQILRPGQLYPVSSMWSLCLLTK